MALTHVSMELSVELDEPILKSPFRTFIDPKTDVSFQYEEPLILYIYTLPNNKRLGCFAKDANIPGATMPKQ